MPTDSRAKELRDWLPLAQDERAVVALDTLVTVPDREELGLGYYPSKATFEGRCATRFYDRLPEASGLVFPYLSRYATSFAVVRELDSETELRPGRAYVYGRGRTYSNRTGLFGGHRLDVKRPFIVLTDDEWRVCTDPAAVACLQMCPEALRKLSFSTRQVRLVSASTKWLEEMAQLVQEGFQVIAQDEMVQTGIARRIINLLKSNRPREAIAQEVRSLLSVLPPLEQVSLLQWLEKELGVPLRSWLVPVPEAWDDQAVFIRQLDAALSDRLSVVQSTDHGLVLYPVEGTPVRLPSQPAAFIGWWLQQAADKPGDLVDWAYNSLGALPAVWLRDGADRFTLHDRLTAVLWQRLWTRAQFSQVM